MPEIVPVARALEIVLGAAAPLPDERVPLDDAAGRVLREAVLADRDYPPFDKSLVDGFAVLAADFAAGPRSLPVKGEIAAGADPGSLRALAKGTATRIMTGAPLPPGADAVVMVEETEAIHSTSDVTFRSAARAGDNLARQGADARAGATLLEAGEFIGPAEIGVLAACGKTQVRTGTRPRVAVLATGDEIVAPSETPRGGQIRNSNGPLLTALVKRLVGEVIDLGVARDDTAALREAIARGLETDCLVISGGVSMGIYDLVGATLRSLGVEILFERVAIKPGKPFVFGRRGRCLVCACPGNPVSCYVIFEVFVRPLLIKMIGCRDPRPRSLRGTLARPLRQRAGRTGYHQARARFEEGHCVVEPIPGTGSADFVSCARGNALAVMPSGVEALAAGESIEVLLLDDFDLR